MSFTPVWNCGPSDNTKFLWILGVSKMASGVKALTANSINLNSSPAPGSYEINGMNKLL